MFILTIPDFHEMKAEKSLSVQSILPPNKLLKQKLNFGPFANSQAEFRKKIVEKIKGNPIKNNYLPITQFKFNHLVKFFI